MVIYKHNWSFEHIYSFRILIYYGKLWYYRTKYGNVENTLVVWRKLWFTIVKKAIVLWKKNHGIIVNYNLQ